VDVSLPWVKGMLSMDGSCCLRMSFVNISFYSSLINRGIFTRWYLCVGGKGKE
jgi:hypothetical protein